MQLLTYSVDLYNLLLTYSVNLPTLLLTCLMTLKIGKIDSTNQELYLVGDMNTNLLPGITDSNSLKLINVCEIVGLSQLITEPTRVTAQFSVPN